MRTWLYRIATNACLTALESRSRRPMPSGLGQDATDPFATLVQQPEVPWLEPAPDVLLPEHPDDPAAVVTSRESIRLAFVAALQHLPPRQRVVLVLRDVLAWRAAEVADLLGTSTAAVNSLLQRARAALDEGGLVRDEMAEPAEPHRRELLDRYVAAFEGYDVQAIVELFTDDAVWEMPPYTGWYHGARAIGDLISTQCPASGPADMRMLRADANGQPAFALYMRDPADGAHKAFQIQVLTLRGTRVSHVGCFFDTSLFRAFGLPQTHPAGPPARTGAPAWHG
jgi:RNA polymerase sigma-70 factor (ECF subfamily)